MVDYRKRKINEPQTDAPLDPLRGGRLMDRARASAVHATGDRVLSHGRRILLRAGLHGADAWHVSDDPVGLTPLHPNSTTARVVARLPAVRLSPGCFPRFVVLANPAGMTEITVDTLPAEAGAKGIVRLVCDFDNGTDTESVTRELSLPPSQATNAAQPSGAGAAWANLTRHMSLPIYPANLAPPAGLAAWCDGVDVALTLSYVGSPRAVDVVVFEEPFALAYDVSAGGWAAPMHGDPNGGNLGQLPGKWPVVRRSATDAGHGGEVLVDAAARCARELGPVLFSATTWAEGDQAFDAAEAASRSVTGTTWTELVSGVTAAYAASGAGWSVSSGANARRARDSEASVVLRDATNVVGVRAFIYAAMSSGTATGTVRFASGPESIAEIAVSGTSWGWHEATGHLRCGLGAQDPTSLQVRARTSGATSSLLWRYLLLVRADV